MKLLAAFVLCFQLFIAMVVLQDLVVSSAVTFNEFQRMLWE